MEEIYTNIYRESRKKAGLEQSEAADMIGVSYHSLAKYEKKINPLIPPDDVVRNMVIAYNDRSLAYKHIKASPLGEFLPNFECSKDLSIATLTFLSDFNTIEGMISQVIEVTKDGKIDETELEEWEQFKKKGLELVNSLNALQNNRLRLYEYEETLLQEPDTVPCSISEDL